MRARNLFLASLLVVGGLSVAAATTYSNVTENDGIGVLAAAEEYSVVFSEFKWGDAYKPATISSGDLTISCDQGEGNNAPAYYTSDSTLRFYSGNSFTISLGGLNISKVTFFGSSLNSVQPSSSLSFTGGSGSYSFSSPYTSVSFNATDKVRLTKIVVTGAAITTLDEFAVSLASDARFDTVSPLSLTNFVFDGVKGDGTPISEGDFTALIGSGTGDSFNERETIEWGKTIPLSSDETIRFVSLIENSDGVYEQVDVSIMVDEPLLTEVRLEGDFLQKQYTSSSEWSVSGLSLVATYDGIYEVPVENDIVWSFDPAKPAVGVTEVTVTATWGGKADSKLISGVVVSDTLVDEITAETLELSGSSYQSIDFTGKSGAHYLGNVAFNKDRIQMNDNKTDRNISTDLSGGDILSIDIVFGDNDNPISILASNTPYTSATDHHGDTLMTTTGSESSISYEFTRRYSYFKIVSAGGAVYISSILVSWGTFTAPEIDSVAIIGEEYLELGKTYNYTINTSPDNLSPSVTWEVDDPSILEIDQGGNVTPKMAGIAVITASLDDYSLKASMEVMVNGGEHDYSFTPNDFSTRYETYEQEMSLDNGLDIAYTNVCQKEYNGELTFQLYRNAGTFENINVLAPIESISLEFVGSAEPILSVGRTQANNEEKVIAGSKEGNVITYEIGGDYDYFKVAAGSSTVYLKNFVIRYVSADEELAYEWALKFVDNAGLTCDPTGVAAPSADQWLERGDEYLNLSEEAQQIIKNAKADENGTVIERALAKYDYIIGKYNPDGSNDDYINFIEREVKPTSAYAGALLSDPENPVILAVSVLTMCALAAGAGYAFYSKRKKED